MNIVADVQHDSVGNDDGSFGGEDFVLTGRNAWLRIEGYSLMISNHDNRISVNLGLRYSGFTQVGPFDRYVKDDSGVIGQSSTTDTISYKNNEIVETYGGFEPRISMPN